jgi:hypothetical protein
MARVQDFAHHGSLARFSRVVHLASFYTPKAFSRRYGPKALEYTYGFGRFQGRPKSMCQLTECHIGSLNRLRDK